VQAGALGSLGIGDVDDDDDADDDHVDDGSERDDDDLFCVGKHKISEVRELQRFYFVLKAAKFLDARV